MRISDLLFLAMKSLKSKWIALPIAAMAIGVFCLCFAGTVLATVQDERSFPYELNVLAGTVKVSDNTIAELLGIPNVTAATPVLQIPVSVQTGKYTAQLTLTGIDATYLDEAFAQGGVFPDSSVMPYIVLNKAACRQLTDETSGDAGADAEEPVIDWLNAAISVQTSGTIKPVVSKVVGILAKDDEAQEPAAYISIASAKALLQAAGQSTDYIGANVRIENIGYSERVSRAIAKLGLSVSDSNKDVQIKWDMELKEMTYLILIGTVCLLSSSAIMIGRIKITQFEQEEVLAALRWIGMKEKEMARIFTIQSILVVLSGIAFGIIVSVLVPSFISPEMQGTTIFSWRIPFNVLTSCAAICMVACIVPICIWQMNKKA